MKDYKFKETDANISKVDATSNRDNTNSSKENESSQSKSTNRNSSDDECNQEDNGRQSNSDGNNDDNESGRELDLPFRMNQIVYAQQSLDIVIKCVFLGTIDGNTYRILHKESDEEEILEVHKTNIFQSRESAAMDLIQATKKSRNENPQFFTYNNRGLWPGDKLYHMEEHTEVILQHFTWNRKECWLKHSDHKFSKVTLQELGLNYTKEIYGGNINSSTVDSLKDISKDEFILLSKQEQLLFMVRNHHSHSYMLICLGKLVHLILNSFLL